MPPSLSPPRSTASQGAVTLHLPDPVISRVRPTAAKREPVVAHLPERVLPGRRGRAYDAPVLGYVAYHATVTLHQVLDMFFTGRGCGPSYGVRVVRALVHAGLLQAERVEPGRAGRHVLRLTPSGYRVLGLRPLQEGGCWPFVMRPYRLQLADMVLQRRAEGFRLVRAADAFPPLHAWACRQYEERPLTAYEAQDRDHLKRLPPYDPTLPILVSGDGSDVRLVLPVRPGLDARALLAGIPRMPFHPPLAFEVVCSKAHEPTHLAYALRAIRRWGAARGQVPRWHCAAPWEERPNPANTSSDL